MRQYIGARYVPTYFENSATGDSTWAEGVPYEALVNVTWNGANYISKKPVPATVGAPNLNREYWISTGSGGGGDIGRLEQEIEDIQDDVQDLQGDYTTLNNKINTTNSNVTALQGRMSEAESDIATIEGQISPLDLLKQRKIVVFSDSYGVGGSQSGATYTPFPSLLQARVNGCIGVTNISESGRGFANASDVSNMNFEQVISAQGSDSTITDVIIAGGYNDRDKSYQTVVQNMYNTIDVAKQRYPKAKIYVAMIGWSWFASEYSQLATTVDRYMLCGNHGASFMGNVNWIMHDLSFFDSDHIHPNSNGHSAIARGMACILNGGNYDCVKVESQITWPARNNNVTMRLRCSANNGTGYISNDGNIPIDLTPYDGRVWANQQIFQLTNEASSGYFRGYNGISVNLPVSVSIDGTNIVFGAATLKLINGAWYFDAGVVWNNAFRDGTLHDLTIPPFSIAINRSTN